MFLLRGPLQHVASSVGDYLMPTLLATEEEARDARLVWSKQDNGRKGTSGLWDGQRQAGSPSNQRRDLLITQSHQGGLAGARKRQPHLHPLR